MLHLRTRLRMQLVHVQDVNTDRLKIKFNHDALYAATGVEDGTQLFIRYTGGADLLEASGGDKDDVGKFETSFQCPSSGTDGWNVYGW